MANRRSFLKGSCTGIVLLAGCSSDLSRSTETSTTPTSEITEVSEVPRCEDIDGTHILTVTPVGASLIAEDEQVAQSALNDTGNSENDDIRVVKSSEEYTIEFLDSTGEQDLQYFVDEYNGITDYHYGLSRPTVNEIGTQIQTSLSGMESISGYSVQYVTTEESSPDFIAAAITVTEGEELATPSEDITYYVETDNGKETIAEGQEIQVTQIEEGSNTGLRMTVEFSESVQNRFQELASQGVLTAYSEQMQVEFRNETLFQGGINRDSLNSMESGSWDGTLIIPVQDSETASEFQSTANLVNVSVPVETNIEFCES